MSLQHLQCIVKQKSPKILEISHFLLVFLLYACSAHKTHSRHDSALKTLKIKGFCRIELLCALQMQTPSIAKAVHCLRTGEKGTFPGEGCTIAENTIRERHDKENLHFTTNAGLHVVCYGSAAHTSGEH